MAAVTAAMVKELREMTGAGKILENPGERVEKEVYI